MIEIKRIFSLTLIVFSCVILSIDCFGQGKVRRTTGQKTSQTAQHKTSIPKAQTIGSTNGHDWVDLGLPSGIKWAICNVGAALPSDYGNYYAWGEVTPKSKYNWNNCFDCYDSDGNKWGHYKKGGITQITPTSGFDTARENWGASWRMPTVAELNELVKECKWIWSKKDGRDGYEVTGPNGNSIFLPAAGNRHDNVFNMEGEIGFYWSNTLGSSDDKVANYLNMYNTYFWIHDGGCRYFGMSVRPVTD